MLAKVGHCSTRGGGTGASPLPAPPPPPAEESADSVPLAGVGPAAARHAASWRLAGGSSRPLAGELRSGGGGAAVLAVAAARPLAGE